MPGGSRGVFGTNLNNFLDLNGNSDQDRLNQMEEVLRAMHRDIAIMAPKVQTLGFMPEGKHKMSGHKNKPHKKAAPKKRMVTDTTHGGKFPVAATGPARVTDVRIGEHRNKTRLVLDITQKQGYALDLDNNEQVLLMEIEGEAWEAPETQRFARSPLVKSYTAQPSNAGSYLAVFQLARPTNILFEGVMGAYQKPGYRLVIDLEK